MTVYVAAAYSWFTSWSNMLKYSIQQTFDRQEDSNNILQLCATVLELSNTKSGSG